MKRSNDNKENMETLSQGLNVDNQGRREFLKSTLAGGILAAAACADSATGLAAPGGSGVLDPGAIHNLKTHVKGAVLAPGDSGYDAARAGFELSVEQRPAVVVMVESAQDVVAAVNFAREHKLGIGVQATGHGISLPANGGLLVNTSRMKAVEVDAAGKTARVQPGAKWKDVAPHVTPHGLAPLSGSSTDVGVVGYTLGGGTGWFARRYGYATNSVISADVVTADGRLVHASATDNPDLFWALRGGVGNFGIVTSLEFKLYPVKEFYGGGIFFPADHAQEVLQAYSRWAEKLPDTFTSRAAIYNMPPIPEVPEPLRGRWVIAVQGAFLGTEAAGADLLRPIRQVAKPVVDTFAMMPYTQVDTIANDPVQPMATLLHSETIREISPQLIENLLKGARVGERSHLAFVEMRHLGGALAAFPGNGSAAGRPDGKFWLNAIAVFRTPEEKALAESDVNRIEEAVKPFSTGRVFLNGLSGPAGSRVRSAYSAENYARLVAVKRKYDPTNLFQFNRNIAPGPIPAGS